MLFLLHDASVAHMNIFSKQLTFYAWNAMEKYRFFSKQPYQFWWLDNFSFKATVVSYFLICPFGL